MTPDKTSIIEKVRKLLAHKDNPNKNEAENAMLLVQRMMAEHNLVMSDVEPKNMVKEVIHGTAFSGLKVPWWYKKLAPVIADNFRCYAYTQRGGISSVRFIGLKEDVELANEVFKYAIEVITYNCKQYIKQNKNREDYDGVKVRNAYIVGFMIGLKDKFAEQVVKHQEWGLIIVKDPIVVKEQSNMSYKRAQNNHIQIGNNHEDKIAGYQAGKQFTPIAGKITGGD